MFQIYNFGFFLVFGILRVLDGLLHGLIVLMRCGYAQNDISMVKTFIEVLYCKMVKSRMFKIGKISNEEHIILTLGLIVTGRLDPKNIQK